MAGAPQSDMTIFPLVRDAQGGPSADGRSLLVEAATVDGDVVRFAVALSEIQHFVAFLLVTTGKICAAHGMTGAVGPDSGPTLPIPATSIAIGAPDGDEGYLEISVGRAELVFSLPLSAFDSLGRTMLTASAPTDDTRVI